MTSRHDMIRLERARKADAREAPGPAASLEDLVDYREELIDAIAGAQSTDEPIGSPDGAAIWSAHESLMSKLRDVDGRIARVNEPA